MRAARGWVGGKKIKLHTVNKRGSGAKLGFLGKPGLLGTHEVLDAPLSPPRLNQNVTWFVPKCARIPAFVHFNALWSFVAVELQPGYCFKLGYPELFVPRWVGVGGLRLGYG